MKTDCIIAAVGRASLHKMWIGANDTFDVHLIVYDDSFDKFQSDTQFITQMKGSKYKLIAKYLEQNSDILDNYRYFYLPDDDVLIDCANVHKLFYYMERYKLAVAQPSIVNSYCSHSHILRQKGSIMRFTNFVEIMQPCFSKSALSDVLFTFSKSNSGWGLDFHWGKILDYTKLNMAILDDVVSVHTRPVRSENSEELAQYLKVNELGKDIFTT